ncbi:MAG: LysE family translocator [Sphingobium sp.]
MAPEAAQLLIAYALTELVACLIPGPAVMSVMGIALTGSLRGMFGAIGGIIFSNLIWYTMVGLGLVALVRTAPLLFEILGWAGIAYLFWMGWDTWRSHISLAAKAERRVTGAWRGFSSAVAVQLSNPKALVFFTVFLPPFIHIDRPVAPQIAILALIGCAIEIMALGTYGSLAYRLGKLALSSRAEKWIAHISGAILIAIAVAMALSRAA